MEKKKSQPGYKWLALVLKILVTAACLWYVSGKIDFAKTGTALQQANGGFLLLAFLLFVISKIIASLRLNLYFRDIGIPLSIGTGLRLYWLGMFYNLFLPGSITGDAYKVVVLSKAYPVSYKQTSAAVLLDRISGLLGLAMILTGFSFFALSNWLHSSLLALGTMGSAGIFYYVLYRYFRVFIRSFVATLLLGVLVQAVQVLCIYCIMGALAIPANTTEYIFIFLVSSVVAVLPLTIGGLGIREVVFLQGSAYFNLAQENSVLISILFYIITLTVSAIGLIYIFRDPLKKKKDPRMSP